MGDVVELKRRVVASTHRFGHYFEIAYRAGRTPATSDPQAGLSVDGELRTWLHAGYGDDSFNSLVLVLDSDAEVVTPETIGASPSLWDSFDYHFLANTEAYLLQLLTLALRTKLGDMPVDVETVEEMEPPETEAPSAWDRGVRAATLWHDTGRVDAALPELVAIEICNAVEYAGRAFAVMLDESVSTIPREECGDFVEGMAISLTEMWREGGPEGEDDD